MKPAFTFSIKTMGCKANIYDSLVIERELNELGGVRQDDSPDVFVLNSCTVTAEADKQAHREIAQVRKRAPHSWAVVTGCYAQIGAEKIAADSNVAMVIPNDGKSRLKNAVASRFGIRLSEAQSELADPEIFWGQLPAVALKTRSFIKIQEGCNDFCTYCIIPYARGKSRSVRMGEILREIDRLTSLGVQEIVLTGTNIADYGKEFGVSLEDLIEAILEKTSVPRLRLTSLDPTEITDRILDRMHDGSRLMPHIHVSLQSPVSRVLRAMKRQYRTEEVISALSRIYKKGADIYVGMDVIVGFPSETEEEHQEGIRILSDLPWARLHVFPYSEREGTPATRIFGSVPMIERKRRANEWMELSRQRHEQFSRRFVDRTLQNVLFESWHEAGGDFFVSGHAENYMRVMARVPSRSKEDAIQTRNQLRSARIVGLSPKPAQDWTLEGALV